MILHCSGILIQNNFHFHIEIDDLSVILFESFLNERDSLIQGKQN